MAAKARLSRKACTFNFTVSPCIYCWKNGKILFVAEASLRWKCRWRLQFCTLTHIVERNIRQVCLGKKKERKQQHKSILLWEQHLECITLDACERTQRSLWSSSFGYWFLSISMASVVTPFFRSVADQNSFGYWSWLILKSSEILKPLALKTPGNSYCYYLMLIMHK